jgi:four helix bundle protein
VREEEGLERKKSIRHFRDLEVYRRAFDAAMQIFEVTKKFPQEERFSMTDQIRRSSRSVCANLAEGWRKRPYLAVFKIRLQIQCGSL